MVNILTKIDYIANKVDDVDNTNKIINYIKINNINYSSNKNGLFVNISLLNEKRIDDLYNLIESLLTIENADNDVNELNYNDKITNKKIVNNKKYNKLQLAPYQIDILELI